MALVRNRARARSKRAAIASAVLLQGIHLLGCSATSASTQDAAASDVDGSAAPTPNGGHSDSGDGASNVEPRDGEAQPDSADAGGLDGDAHGNADAGHTDAGSRQFGQSCNPTTPDCADGLICYRWPESDPGRAFCTQPCGATVCPTSPSGATCSTDGTPQALCVWACGGSCPAGLACNGGVPYCD